MVIPGRGTAAPSFVVPVPVLLMLLMPVGSSVTYREEQKERKRKSERGGGGGEYQGCSYLGAPWGGFLARVSALP